MLVQSLELTTALRPELLPDETLLYVQHGVGLYEGDYKSPQHQNGQIYLTSHRICYVDNDEPRRSSTAISLKQVDRYEHYAGFLKSSAKVTVYPKPLKGKPLPVRSKFSSSPGSQSPSQNGSGTPFTDRVSPSNNGPLASLPAKPASITWVCPICTFPNTVPPSFDPTTASEHTILPSCQTCGIKPPLAHLLKVAIASTASRPLSQRFEPARTSASSSDLSRPDAAKATETVSTQSTFDSRVQCPRCTFENHPSLPSCEICGASLVTESMAGEAAEQRPRTDSPGPTMDPTMPPEELKKEYIKISFRQRGDKIFYERLKGAMAQRKWLLEHAPPIQAVAAQSESLSNRGSGTFTPEPKGVGIAGLERLGLERRKNNETVISSAFEDLDALMASAKELMALAESMAEKTGDASASKLLNDSAAGLGMTATKDMLDSTSGSGSLYLSELSRSLAEYLTDDSQAVLKREGGVMSLVDFWAEYNRKRHGVELVSPSDFEKAAKLWERYHLPVRLREFRNGLLVVQRYDWTDDKTIAQLLTWLQDLREEEPRPGTQWDQAEFGRGVTAHEAAIKFGWSVGVANEELEMAEERGVLCREEGIEGLKFWENLLVTSVDLMS